ncbi:MAG TPA: hypothetical protein VIM89_13605 [Mucilaginibacter sp.]
MASKSKIPTPITVIVIVIIVAAIATWLLPAGEYYKLSYNDNTFTISNGKTVPCTQHTLDSLHIRIKLEKFKNGDIRKPVAIPGTYHQLKKNRQGPLNVSQAPIKGIYDTVDIIFFILIIGGFITIFNQTGAMEKGMAYLSHLMKGKEAWLIVIVTFFFTFCGSTEGMAEEGLVFYPILVPLFLAAGYDLLVPVAVIFAGCNIGNLTSFSNPFSTIIASNAAGINWADGFYERILAFLVTSGLLIWYIVRYAQKVKKDPTKSLVYRIDGNVQSPFPVISKTDEEKPKLGRKNAFLLILFFATIFTMIGGVLFDDWWLLEMTTVFLVSSVLIAFIIRMPEKVFIESFVKGVQSLISVALLVGVARGVTIILNDGHITDTILFYAANTIGTLPSVIFIIALLALYIFLTLFISSSSGMAVLTMPVFGALSVIVGVPGKEIVNAYNFGMGIMYFLAPTGLILPSLMMVNVSIKAWLRFVYPLMVMLTIVCLAFLIIGVL